MVGIIQSRLADTIFCRVLQDVNINEVISESHNS